MSFNVTAFGAVPNGETLQTAAVQAAIDACFLAGGGEVIVPRGVFLIGDIRLRSRVTLHLLAGAVLKGSRDPADYFSHLADKIEPLDPAEITAEPIRSARDVEAYDPADHRIDSQRLPASPWNNALIRAIHAEDVAIVGEDGAVIDGNNCYDPRGEEQYRGPHGIGFFDVRGVTLRGYILKNSANWAHKLNGCTDVRVERVTVLAGHDGLDLYTCRRTIVRDCAFYTGDDCVAGYGNTDVTVENCVINSACSGMRFGGTDVLVQGCRFEGLARYAFRGRMSQQEKESGAPSAENPGRRMLSVFTYYADPRFPILDPPGNIVLRNCTVSGASRLLHYNFSGNERWQRCYPLPDVTFEDVSAEDILTPVTAYGTAETPIALTLRRVRVSMREGAALEPFARLCHFSRVTLEDVTVRGAAECLLLARSAGEVSAVRVKTEPPVDLLHKTDAEFTLTRI